MGHLSTRAYNLLCRLVDAEDLAAARGDFEALTYSKGEGWWLGTHRCSGNDVLELLRFCLISADSFNSESYQLYAVNEDGRRLAADRAAEPSVVTALRRQRQYEARRGKVRR